MVPQKYMRVKFRKGKQREFLQMVLKRIDCPSLRALINRGFDVPYSTLKNYFAEERTLPKDLFDSLCYVAKINPQKLRVVFLEEGWGRKIKKKKF